MTGRKLPQLAGSTNLHGLKFLYEGEREFSRDYVQFIFADRSNGARIVLVDDYVNHITYVSFQEVPDLTIQLLENWLRDNLGTADLDEVKKHLRENLETNSFLLTHLGLMETVEERDPATIDILQKAPRSPKTEIVEKGLVAAQLLGWTELKGDIEHVAHHASTRHLRSFAEKALVQI